MVFSRQVLLLYLVGFVFANAFQAFNSEYQISKHKLDKNRERTAFLLPKSRDLASISPVTLSAKKPVSKLKKVGCGIPPSYDYLCCFDPEENGQLQGTGDFTARMEGGLDFDFGKFSGKDASTAVASGPPAGADLLVAQHWLEHLDHDADGVTRIDPPVNTIKSTAPVDSTLLGSGKLIGPDAPGDIRHVILSLPEGMHYVEGQSISVIPPGLQENGKPHKPRLYSIASTRYGDTLEGDTVSLCVRRAEYYDPVTGLADSSKKGVCSNFLCDATPGTTVKISGPVGKTMLLPSSPKTDVIMVATGTGIAPFRAFLHRLFMENTLAKHTFEGTAWLVLGVPVTSGLLYKEEIASMQESAGPGMLKVNYAISREMKNKNGGKYYVQDAIAENADEVFNRLDNGAQIYFCGLKGMMPPIEDTFAAVAEEQGINWPEKLKELKSNHQWHVEVY